MNALPEQRYGAMVDPISGEVYLLENPRDAAAAYRRAAELYQTARQIMDQASDRLRDHLDRQGVTSALVGEYEVEEQPGRATYDVQQLVEALTEAGMPDERISELVTYEPKVDGRELGKLERRNERWARAIESARTRARGRLAVKQRTAAAPAPSMPEGVQHEARKRAALDHDAEEKGI